MTNHYHFHWADYVVTGAVLLVSVAIGIFFAVFKGGQKTKVAYLLGDRKMSLAPVCLSMFVTFQSAISLIGVPGDTYSTGPMIMYNSFGYALAHLLGLVIVVPLVYPLHITSVYAYLDMRFRSKAVRLLATCIGMMQTMMYMAVALLAPALAMQAAAGLSMWVSVILMGFICTIYTAVGGIKSVVWTDAFQVVIILIGVVAIMIKGVQAVGDLSTMMTIASEGGRLNFAETDIRERHSLWSCIFGSCIIWLVNCFNQSSVQRIGSLKTLRAAKLAFILNAPLNIVFGFSLTFMGILLYAYVVATGCDPYRAGLVFNKNQMMPYFVIHVLADLPGMAGLFLSMLLSGALSTLSSGINALAANTIEDLLENPLRNMKDAAVTVLAKVLVVFYGALIVGLAYFMKSMQGPVTQMASTVFGACGGPVVGMFLLAGGFPRGNKYGALGGTMIGLAVNLWIAIGSTLYGFPTRSLPPGPIDNCISTNSSSPGIFNASSNGVILYGVMANVTSGESPVLLPEMLSTASTALGKNTTTTAVERGDFSIYDISYTWFGLIGSATSLLTGIVISLITSDGQEKAPDCRLIFPFLRRFYGLPEPVFRPSDFSNVLPMTPYEDYENSYPEKPRHGEETGRHSALLSEGNSKARLAFLRTESD